MISSSTLKHEDANHRNIESPISQKAREGETWKKKNQIVQQKLEFIGSNDKEKHETDQRT